jgi:hypothetical protein
MPTCDTKIAAQRPMKDACNLSFLPVIASDRAMMKLVAASVKVSMIPLYRVKDKK